MAVRRLAPRQIQPKEFAFTADNLAWAKEQIAKYPEGRQASAVIPLLWRAQEQTGGWVPEAAIRYVAEVVSLAYIRVLEVATFYTMFNLEPVGRFHVQLCGTTPCMLRGAEELKDVCHSRIGEQHHVTADGTFSWVEVECLGACVNAPMVQINYDFYEDLTPESFTHILDELAAGRVPPPGPQVDRQLSAPIGGLTTLTDPSLYQQANGGGPAAGTRPQEGTPATDDAAKRPGEAATRRDEPAPRPPEDDASLEQQSSSRRE
jgi:NADH-quinone oxidoreductase subunit E